MLPLYRVTELVSGGRQRFQAPQDAGAGLSEMSELIQPSVLIHNTIIWTPTMNTLKRILKKVILGNVYISRQTRCKNSCNESLFEHKALYMFRTLWVHHQERRFWGYIVIGISGTSVKRSTRFGLLSPSSGATFLRLYRNWYKPVGLLSALHVSDSRVRNV